MSHTVEDGFQDHERPGIAKLYWEAFGAKLGIVMGPERRAIDYLVQNMSPKFAVAARNRVGTIIGVAGFKTAQGAFVGGDLRSLASTYGWLSTIWRAPILAMVDRELKKDVLLMDGICVSSAARGCGVGTMLLNAIKQKAQTFNCGAVRLDVIASNTRARKLYEREGFKPVRKHETGLLSGVLGFESMTEMIWRRAGSN